MASTDVLVHLNMNGNEIQNVLAQKLATAPTTNLSAGRFYYNTTDNTLYIYNGTGWLNALAQGTTYTGGSGIDITGNTISVDFTDAATAAQGALADSALQPNDNISELYNNAGYITSASLPTKISDLTDDTATYPIDKADTLTGLTATVAELNIMDGVTVTASDINSVTSKIGLTNLSIASGSSNYLGYDNTNGQISAKVDTTVGTVSTNLVTSGAVQTAINNAISNVYKAQGTVAFASLPALSSSIEGYVYNISDAFTTTSDFVEGSGKSYPAGTNVVCINTTGTTYKWDVLAGTIDTSSFITVSSTNTLTNKTIDADDNTISNLQVSNFKSGVVQTSVRKSVLASNTALVTEKAVNDAVEVGRYRTGNPALTATSGVCTWNITIPNSAAYDRFVDATIYKEVTSGTYSKVVADVTVTGPNELTVKINSTANIAAGTLEISILYYRH